jgi:hypothetical protein
MAQQQPVRKPAILALLMLYQLSGRQARQARSAPQTSTSDAQPRQAAMIFGSTGAASPALQCQVPCTLWRGIPNLPMPYHRQLTCSIAVHCVSSRPANSEIRQRRQPAAFAAPAQYAIISPEALPVRAA